MHEGSCRPNLRSQSLRLPGQVEERRFPVCIRQHQPSNNPQGQRKALQSKTTFLLHLRLIMHQFRCTRHTAENAACRKHPTQPQWFYICSYCLTYMNMNTHPHTQTHWVKTKGGGGGGVAWGTLTTKLHFCSRVGFEFQTVNTVRCNYDTTNSARKQFLGSVSRNAK